MGLHFDDIRLTVDSARAWLHADGFDHLLTRIEPYACSLNVREANDERDDARWFGLNRASNAEKKCREGSRCFSFKGRPRLSTGALSTVKVG